MDGERSPGDPEDESATESTEPSPAPDAEEAPDDDTGESNETEEATAEAEPPEDTERESGDDRDDAADGDGDRPDGEEAGDEDVAEADEDEDVDEEDGNDYQPTSIDEDYQVADVSPYAQVDGPSEDQEMPLAEHIEEMLKRLAVIIAIAGIVSLVTFPIAEELINFLWNSILPEGELTRPRLYGILELKLTELKVASLAGLIVALPVLVHQTYQFMRPGLYPHERRYYLAAIPTSLVLALVGVSFAYFIVLPAIFTYFLYYSQDVATIGFALGRTFDLILILMGYLAIVFQIPLFIMLAMMMGLVTRQWLADRRILFWGGFLGISFIFSPDPTGMAPIVVALTMVVLFEGTLLLTKWTQGRSSAADG